jgi:transposase
MIDSDDSGGGAFLRSAAATHLGRRLRVRFWYNELRSRQMSVDEWSRRIQRRAHQTQRQARRDCDRAWRHLHHFKHHMHFVAIGFLWRHWDVLIASTANIGTMCRREWWDARGNAIAKRPFNSRSARAALNWGHGAFSRRLISCAYLRPGAVVIETGEAFTTQTCGLCGTRNPNVGSAKVFACADAACGVRIDRGVNCARNIALRVMTQHLRS